MKSVQKALDRIRLLRIKSGLLIFWAALFIVAPLKAQTSGSVQMTAEAGFDGYCKDFRWLPVKVSLENNGPDLEGRLEARLPNLFGTDTVFMAPISLPSPARKEFFLYVYPEASFLNKFPLALISGDQEIARIQVNIDCSRTEDRFFGILAADPSAFSVLAGLDPGPGRAILASMDLSSLPEQAAAYQPLDIILISGVDTGQLTDGQRQALSGWVAVGGQLWVTGGADWGKTSAGLTDLVPFQPSGTSRLNRLESLSSFANRQPGLQGSVIIATGKTTRKAQTLVSEGDLPVIISRTWGYGQVIYLAADPSQEPLRNWPGLVDLYRKLLDRTPEIPSFARGFQDWGYAANSLGSLAGLRMPPASLVLGLLAAYVLAIGPANYLLLRIFHRRELAWVTIPAVVLLFSILAFGLGIRGRGSRPVIQRLAIVQSFPDIREARVDALVGFFSPSRRTYQVNIGPSLLAHPIPENNSLSAGGGWIFEQKGSLGMAIPDVRIEVGGMKAVSLEGQIPAPSIRAELTLDLNSQAPSLVGTLSNESDITLEDAVILSNMGRQPVGTLSPGKKIVVKLLPHTDAYTGEVARDKSAVPAPPVGPGFVGPFAYNDPFLVDLFGTGDFYSNPETYRRFSLIGATIPFNQVSNAYRAGVFLAGWTKEAPFDTVLEGQKADVQDTTLYLISLPVELPASTGRLTFTPSLFNWESLDVDMGYSAAPYNLKLGNNDFTFSYTLAVPVEFHDIVSLTLHLVGSGNSGQVGFDVYLWDFDLGQWIRIDSPIWGDNPISTPDRFVSSNGEVRLWVDAGAQSQPVLLEAANFTLVVDR